MVVAFPEAEAQICLDEEAMATDNFKGAFFMSASMAGFVLNDALMKLVGPDLGLFQTIFVRGLFSILFLGAFAVATGAFRVLPEGTDRKLISIRTVAEVAATLLFLTALFNMEIANATAILQILPLTIALGAAVFLAEPIGPRRLMAILLGLVGVLLIVRPVAQGFNIYSLFALAAVMAVTMRDLIVRQFSPAVSSLLVAFITSVVITSAGAMGLILQGYWTPIGWAEIRILAPAAACLVVGYYCSVAAMRIGDVAVVATYRYTILVWAMLLGIAVFGEIPDLISVCGMVLIVGAGIFTMLRERRTNAD